MHTAIAVTPKFCQVLHRNVAYSKICRFSSGYFEMRPIASTYAQRDNVALQFQSQIRFPPDTMSVTHFSLLSSLSLEISLHKNIALSEI